MTQAQRYKYPLHLPQSLKGVATRLAIEGGVSLDQRIVPAVARQIGAMEMAADFLKARAGTARRGDLTRLLDRSLDTESASTDVIECWSVRH